MATLQRDPVSPSHPGFEPTPSPLHAGPGGPVSFADLQAEDDPASSGVWRLVVGVLLVVAGLAYHRWNDARVAHAQELDLAPGARAETAPR